MSAEDQGSRIIHDFRTRRPTGYWTPAVHALLDHLHRVGFEHVPRVIGIDGQVEILSFIAGRVLHKGDERSIDDEMLTSVARLIRAYHDAVRSFTPPPFARWQPTSIPTTGTLVCHNDLYLGNIVFDHRDAIGIIDFDVAHPADPLWDLAMAAWHWLALLSPDRALTDDLPRRLRLFLDAYGLDRRRQDILAIITDLGLRMRQNHAKYEDEKQTGRFNNALDLLERDAEALRKACQTPVDA